VHPCNSRAESRLSSRIKRLDRTRQYQVCAKGRLRLLGNNRGFRRNSSRWHLIVINVGHRDLARYLFYASFHFRRAVRDQVDDGSPDAGRYRGECNDGKRR